MAKKAPAKLLPSLRRVDSSTILAQQQQQQNPLKSYFEVKQPAPSSRTPVPIHAVPRATEPVARLRFSLTQTRAGTRATLPFASRPAAAEPFSDTEKTKRLPRECCCYRTSLQLGERLFCREDVGDNGGGKWERDARLARGASEEHGSDRSSGCHKDAHPRHREVHGNDSDGTREGE